MHALELIVRNTRACAPIPRRASDIAARSLATHGYLPKSASDGVQNSGDPLGPGPLPASIAFSPSMHQYLTCGGLSTAPAALRKVPSQMSLLRAQQAPTPVACECHAAPAAARKAHLAGNECTNIAAAGRPSHDSVANGIVRGSADGAAGAALDVARSGHGMLHSAFGCAVPRGRQPPPQFGEGIPEGRTLDPSELDASHASPLKLPLAGPASANVREAESAQCPLHGAGSSAGGGFPTHAHGGYVSEGGDGMLLAHAQRAYLPAMRLFTFLRLTRELVEPRSQGHWLRFMSEMRQQAPMQPHKNLALAS